MSKFRYEILNDRLQIVKKFGVSLPKELLGILNKNNWDIVRGNSFKHQNSKKSEQMQLF